ncbi:hypothetical protein [Pseudovibrio sp. Tun.PSC04-5.I4]|uniref:hypothetical protein n=1 Tax=Pseudovibrio sp. Tun.PSC04-5.I4 TaxID=1798213 RepID=UPI0008818246|nr:hypothetical protein [Pseudovibrio sp. Tun.PSC04-5.I4]SDR39433.1 hypothetical protein SAMN04515695_5301 [Pseudovibrio sp. Tun.PSC04-5.I4]
MAEHSLLKDAKQIQTRDVADYCAKMCRELSDLARANRLDLLGYLLVLAEKEAEARVSALPQAPESDARETQLESSSTK